MSPSSAPQLAPAYQPPRHIAIEGPIRVGKSTLARILADRLHARRVLDPEDNPFLADFYREKPGAAFRAQMYFLIERHRQLGEVPQADTASPVVSDFLFEKDKIFAYINLENEELKSLCGNPVLEFVTSYESLNGQNYESRIAINNLVLTNFHFGKSEHDRMSPAARLSIGLPARLADAF